MRVLLAIGALIATSLTAAAQDRPAVPRPGKDFQSAETRALQEDETRNPGMLWVEQGQKHWDEPAGASGKSCASCHGAATASMTGVAARYPRVEGRDQGGGWWRPEVIALETRINDCRMRQQKSEPLSYESNPLLSLTAFVAYQSRGLPRRVANDPMSLKMFDAGQSLYQTRQGQLNLSCAQCHDDLVGKKLRGDTISQAQTHGWPAYRLEWQTMGSLQRRLRACSLGVRAEVLDYGHPDYLALELYLAWRGEGLPMESPGVRR